jgi:hypothetical protein
MQEARCEALWRAGAWDTADLLSASGPEAGSGFHSSIFFALNGLYKGQSTGEGEVQKWLRAARHATMADIGRDDVQVTKRSKSLLLQLQACENVDECVQALSSGENLGENLSKLVTRWHTRYAAFEHDFGLVEPCVSMHTALLSICSRSLHAEDPIRTQLGDHLCRAAKMASRHGNMAFARAALQRMRLYHPSAFEAPKPHEVPSAWRIREAKTLWVDGQKDKVLQSPRTTSFHGST